MKNILQTIKTTTLSGIAGLVAITMTGCQPHTEPSTTIAHSGPAIQAFENGKEITIGISTNNIYAFDENARAMMPMNRYLTDDEFSNIMQNKQYDVRRGSDGYVVPAQNRGFFVEHEGHLHPIQSGNLLQSIDMPPYCDTYALKNNGVK